MHITTSEIVNSIQKPSVGTENIPKFYKVMLLHFGDPTSFDFREELEYIKNFFGTPVTEELVELYYKIKYLANGKLVPMEDITWSDLKDTKLEMKVRKKECKKES